MKLSEFTVKKPITTLMLVMSIVVLGWISVFNVPLEYLPEFSSRHLRINVPYPSSSPGEIEKLITLPIEDVMSTTKHIDMIRSNSSSSWASITLRFRDGTDMDLAATEVRDKIDRVKKDLPDDVERIYIYRFQSTDLPALEATISYEGDRDALQRVVEQVIQRRLQRIDGVADVDVRGLTERALIVDLDKERMEAHGVDTYELRRTLRNNNLNLSAGYITDGGRRYIVRAVGEFQTVDEVASLPLKGARIRLRDVAEVRYDFPERTRYQLLDGREAVGIAVYKSSNANLVAVAKRAKEEIERIRKDPRYPGLNIRVIRDRSEEVLKNLFNLRNAGLLGGLLVIFILYFFLRSVRTTLIIALAIPISVLGTFCLMYLDIRLMKSTITLNIVSMSGLMVSLGMLVDPAVVVLENIFRLRHDEGLGAREAAIRGSAEVAVAMLAATATTMCVFISLIFFSKSWMARILRDFALAVCFALAASLAVSLTLIPLMASRMLGRKTARKSLFVRALTALYRRVIGLTLRFRWTTISLAFLLSVFSLYLYSNLGKSRVHRRPTRRVRIRVDTPRTYDLERSNELFSKLTTLLLRKKEEFEIASIGAQVRRDGGILDIFLTDEEHAKRSTEDISEAIKEELPGIPGVRYRAGRLWGIGGEEVGVSVELLGRNMATLELLAEQTMKLIEDVPFVTDIDNDIESGSEEIIAVVNRKKAQAYGLSPQRVAWGVSAALSSRAASKFKTADKEVDIKVQVAEEDRVSLEQLKNLEFENELAENVTFDRLADFKRVKGRRNISRQDRMSIVRVTANTRPKLVYKVKQAIRERLANLQLPPGYKWVFGDERYRRREEKESNFALLLAVVLIYMIMASLFESFAHPLVMMLAIPFAFTGVAFVFHVTVNPIDDLTLVGVMLLCGLVVNNAIVLIDYVNRLRRSGMDRDAAIIKGGCDRLRPVLMTALTTILGLTPMVMPLLVPGVTRLVEGWMPQFIISAYHAALAVAEHYVPSMFKPLEGHQRTWAPMTLAVVSGLTTSTILTLVILPTIYSVVDDFAEWLKKFFATA